MRRENIDELEPEELLEDWGAADWKDIEGLLESIDKLLAGFDLELIVGNRGDDNWWVKIVPKEVKVG